MTTPTTTRRDLIDKMLQLPFTENDAIWEKIEVTLEQEVKVRIESLDGFSLVTLLCTATKDPAASPKRGKTTASPVANFPTPEHLSMAETTIIDGKDNGRSAAELAELRGLPLGLVKNAIAHLVEKKIVFATGKGRGTRYVSKLFLKTQAELPGAS